MYLWFFLFVRGFVLSVRRDLVRVVVLFLLHLGPHHHCGVGKHTTRALLCGEIHRKHNQHTKKHHNKKTRKRREEREEKKIIFNFFSLGDSSCRLDETPVFHLGWQTHIHSRRHTLFYYMLLLCVYAVLRHAAVELCFSVGRRGRCDDCTLTTDTSRRRRNE